MFANVRLNRLLAEALPVDEVFIVPPMGADGLVVGGALQFLLERDGLATWLSHRQRLTNVYWGSAHDTSADSVFANAPGVARGNGDPLALAADWLSQGRIGAIYTGPMGSMAPRPRGAQHTRQSRRSEFMPFAPLINEQDAAEVFDLGNLNRYAARFMTISCGVRRPWRDRIPGVVHIDGSARPQLINRAENPCYLDILAGFKARTGLPALVNTSLNVHEEPIVNRPEECLKTLTEGRVDFVVTPGSLWHSLG